MNKPAHYVSLHYTATTATIDRFQRSLARMTRDKRIDTDHCRLVGGGTKMVTSTKIIPYAYAIESENDPHNGLAASLEYRCIVYQGRPDLKPEAIMTLGLCDEGFDNSLYMQNALSCLKAVDKSLRESHYLYRTKDFQNNWEVGPLQKKHLQAKNSLIL